MDYQQMRQQYNQGGQSQHSGQVPQQQGNAPFINFPNQGQGQQQVPAVPQQRPAHGMQPLPNYQPQQRPAQPQQRPAQPQQPQQRPAQPQQPQQQQPAQPQQKQPNQGVVIQKQQDFFMLARRLKKTGNPEFWSGNGWSPVSGQKMVTREAITVLNQAQVLAGEYIYSLEIPVTDPKKAGGKKQGKSDNGNIINVLLILGGICMALGLIAQNTPQ